MDKILVIGAAGFIGGHLCASLKNKGNYIVGVDINQPIHRSTLAVDEFYELDATNINELQKVFTSDITTVYQLAADMGGAGYIFTGDNDADIMTNSAIINLNVLQCMVKANIKNVFYSSSACAYPDYNQLDPDNPLCTEESVYPANPDSEYGWEKLFSERLYMSYARNYGLNVRIARFHNIFGPYGSWNNGKEKAPAALCRKVAMAKENDTIEIWGPGTQTRTFLYIDECITGIEKIMQSDYKYPLNLGSENLISINDLALLVASVANKKINIKNVEGPVGVMGRKSDNTLIFKELGWKPQETLEQGILETYIWIEKQLTKSN